MTGRIILFFCLLIVAGCQSAEQKANSEIEKAEKALYGEDENFKFDEALARNAIKAYKSFSVQFPKNEKTPDILFKAADLHRALKEYTNALNIYKKVELEYPDYSKAPHSIFLQGFVYENELFRLEKAKERYETFLKKYPDHELSDDVEFSLKNLGKTPEEIIKEFEKQSQPEPETDTGSST